MQTACFFVLKVKYIRVYVVKQLGSFDMMFFVKTLGSKQTMAGKYISQNNIFTCKVQTHYIKLRAIN